MQSVEIGLLSNVHGLSAQTCIAAAATPTPGRTLLRHENGYNGVDDRCDTMITVGEVEG